MKYKDWQELKNIIPDIELIFKQNRNDAHDRLELSKLIYKVESAFTEIKKELNLFDLNNSIKSESVTASFSRREFLLGEIDDLFPNSLRSIKFFDYLRANDLQFWLLIFLLQKNNEIRTKKLTLYQIIDMFIEYYGNDSFKLEDIEYTFSGATRIKTNLRFAFNQLKDVGLVNLYDYENEKSWSLTYFGFIIAASLCIKPITNINPFSKNINRFHQSSWYFKINTHIVNRIKELTDSNYFSGIIDGIALETLGLKNINKGYDLFDKYYKFLSDLKLKQTKSKVAVEQLRLFFQRLEVEMEFDEYMTDLSTKFDAEAWFENIKNKFYE